MMRHVLLPKLRHKLVHRRWHVARAAGGDRRVGMSERGHNHAEYPGIPTSPGRFVPGQMC